MSEIPAELFCIIGLECNVNETVLGVRLQIGKNLDVLMIVDLEEPHGRACFRSRGFEVLKSENVAVELLRSGKIIRSKRNVRDTGDPWADAINSTIGVSAENQSAEHAKPEENTRHLLCSFHTHVRCFHVTPVEA
jgi:hypothetical protein